MRHLPNVSVENLEARCPVLEVRGLGLWMERAVCSGAALVCLSVLQDAIGESAFLAAVVAAGMSLAALAATVMKFRESRFVVAADDNSVYFVRRSDHEVVAVDWDRCRSVSLETGGVMMGGADVSLVFENYTGAQWRSVSGAALEVGNVCTIKIDSSDGPAALARELSEAKNARGGGSDGRRCGER